MSYLLSVVIPTRNRQEYAAKVVRQVLTRTTDATQVVLQDNSDKPTLGDELSREIVECHRFKYQYRRDRLSFVSNFDEALLLADGEYVCMLGDDDGVLDTLEPAVRWAKAKGYQVLRPALSVVYFWPKSGVSSKDDAGSLSISSWNDSVIIFDPRKGIEALLANGCLNYLDVPLAKLYHGVVANSLIRNLRKKQGSCVGGLSPDIYLAVALSTIAEGCASVGFPLTISGICRASGSSASATGAHTGRLEDAPHFFGHVSYEWSPQVPRFYSVETIWADSALAAIRDTAPELESRFKADMLDSALLSKYPQFKSEILSSYKSIGDVGNLYLASMRRFIECMSSSIVYRTAHHSQKEFAQVVDVDAAYSIATRYTSSLLARSVLKDGDC